MSSNLDNTQAREKSISLDRSEITREPATSAEDQTRTVDLSLSSQQPLDSQQMPQSFRSNNSASGIAASDELVQHLQEAVEKKRSAEEALESVREGELRHARIRRPNDAPLLVGASIVTRLMRYLERILENIHDKIFALFNLQKKKKPTKVAEQKSELSKEQSSEGPGVRGA
jgi:hypothetical protein